MASAMEAVPLMRSIFAAEFVGRYRVERKSTCSHCVDQIPSALTAIGNDYGFEEIFRGSSRLWVNPEMWSWHITSGNSSKCSTRSGDRERRWMVTLGLSWKARAEKRRRSRHLLVAYRQLPSADPKEAHHADHSLLSGFVEGHSWRLRVHWINERGRLPCDDEHAGIL